MEQEMGNDHLEYPWQQTVLDAFQARPAELAAKIQIAEQAILARLKNRDKIPPVEYLALDDALRSLRVLMKDVRSERNGSSDGNGKKSLG